MLQLNKKYDKKTVVLITNTIARVSIHKKIFFAQILSRLYYVYITLMKTIAKKKNIEILMCLCVCVLEERASANYTFSTADRGKRIHYIRKTIHISEEL